MVINLISLPTSCKNILYLLHTDALWCYTKKFVLHKWYYAFISKHGIWKKLSSLSKIEKTFAFWTESFILRHFLMLRVIRNKDYNHISWFIFLQALILPWYQFPTTRMKAPWRQGFGGSCEYLSERIYSYPACGSYSPNLCAAAKL